MSSTPQAPGPAPVIPLNTLPLAEAKRRLKQSFDAGDQVRPSRHPDYMLVSSKSRPGFWHATSLEHCDCEAHATRGICRHRVRVSYERWSARRNTPALRHEAV